MPAPVVPLVDLSSQHLGLESELAAAFLRVLRSGEYILGPAVRAFEEQLAEHVGTPWVVGVSSGTDALLAALMALGIGPHDEVITTPFSFVATASAIVRLHATPVFVDVEPSTLNLDPSRLASSVTSRTKAIIAVHLFGQPADVERLAYHAREVPIVEDAAQALGARWRGRAVGNLGTLASFSFFPSKTLGGLGDGGAIACSSEELWHRCRMLRSHGATEKYRHELLGGNFRLDALQAALLSVKLPLLETWNGRRRELAARYSDALADLPGLGCPSVHEEATPVFSQYTIRVLGGYREALVAFLAGRGVATAVHYPLPLHQQPCLRGVARLSPGALPVAEQAAREVLSLPLFPELSDAQQGRVIDGVRAFFSR